VKSKIIAFFKKEIVLVVAAVLAFISGFIVPPTKAYMEYIDWCVLGILLSLMTVMAGLQKNGLFDTLVVALLKRTKKVWQLAFVLVFLCFFLSMLITNDVALITFVPFAILTLKKVRTGTAGYTCSGSSDNRSQPGQYADSNRQSPEFVFI